MHRRHTVGASQAFVLCVALFFSASCPTQATADQTSALRSAFLGTWCGQDESVRWEQTNLPDGTYTQFNRTIPGIEAPFSPHEEFGTWSIDGTTLTKLTQGIKYNDADIRSIDPPWPLSFRITKLCADELVIEQQELGLAFRSTRDCTDGT